MTEQTSPQPNRRGLLAAAAATTAAVAAGRALSGTRAEAANGNPIIIGGAKVGTSTTYLYPNFNDDGFVIWNASDGGIATCLTALQGGNVPFPDSPRNAAVYARNENGSGVGVMAHVTKQFGVGIHALATAFNSTPIYAQATGGSSAAIEAKNVSGPAILSTGGHYGIQAIALNQFGVGAQGVVDKGKGVEGVSTSGIGVAASTTDGVALQVRGPNEFTQAGTGSVPAGKRNVTVTGPKVRAGAGVLVTLNTAPPPDTWVQFARVVGPDKVVVILNQKTTKPIKFTYFVVANPDQVA